MLEDRSDCHNPGRQCYINPFFAQFMWENEAFFYSLNLMALNDMAVKCKK